jgi:hypothetical protein
MCFCYLHFCISTVLFQYHEEHQYPIRGHGRIGCTGPLTCMRSFTDLPHHFDSGDYKLRPLMMYHSENPQTCYIFPALSVFTIHGDVQEHNLHV